MVRRIIFEIEGAKAVAVMHDDKAPKTCEAIWNMLPLEGMSIHAIWAGREIMLHLEGGKYIKLEQEGPPYMFTAPGDIIYFHRGPRLLLGKQKAYSKQYQGKLTELAVFYGWNPSGSFGFGDMTWVTTRILFATIEEIPSEFYLKCEQIRYGMKKLMVRRLEE